MAHLGRPLKYETVAALEKIVNKYFRECDPHWIKEMYYDYPLVKGKKDYSKEQVKLYRTVLTPQQPYTMAGLARRLDMSRQGLMEYKAKDDFSDTIKAARSKVEEYNERQLHSGRSSIGAIFNLKVNFGYYEKPDENPPPENPIRFTNDIPIDGPTE